MTPVLALVGRPNVGKSTLFNRLTASRTALVADLPGLTRDRQYGYATLADRRVVLIDTGGLSGETELAQAAEAQTWHAIAEADHVLFLVDARSGIVPGDAELAQRLRASGKPVWLLANKAEGLPPTYLAEFHTLGFKRLFAVSAERGSGLPEFQRAIAGGLPVSSGEEIGSGGSLAVTVIGRPNVGKSTLVNRLLGEERLLASEIPGTTRDAVYVRHERNGRGYVLVDTAGLRRRTHVEPGAEKLGVMAALRALESARVAIVVTDAAEGMTIQDQRLVRLALERGRGVVIALNKWDHLAPEVRHHALATAERRLAFASFVRRIQISALYGTGLGELMAAVDQAGAAAEAELSTPELNRVLERLVAENEPPLIRGRRVKLRYAHQGGINPPRIVVHGTQAERLPSSYRRYLVSGFREAFRLLGIPLQLELKSSLNPYAKKPPGFRSRTSNRRK